MTALVLSSSSVSSYLDCHLQWWFTYMAVEPGGRREQLEIGIATHALAEEALKIKQGVTFAGQPEPRMGHIWDEANRLMEVYYRDVLPIVDPWLVEAQYQFEIGGILYQSILDAADKNGVVRDLKTTSRRPSKTNGRYKIPMIGHALGFRVMTDMIETDVILDFIVRTKTAYHWPVSLGQLTEDDVDLFEATLQGVAEGIDRADFEPTGLDTPWACKGCQHAARCGPYQRYKEVTGG